MLLNDSKEMPAEFSKKIKARKDNLTDGLTKNEKI